MSPSPFSLTKTSGLSVALFSSTCAMARACIKESRTAPWTCGVQRRLYASWTRGSLSDERCDSRIVLPSLRSARWRAVRADKIYLQLADLFAGDANAGEFAEAGVDAVSGLTRS